MLAAPPPVSVRLVQPWTKAPIPASHCATEDALSSDASRHGPQGRPSAPATGGAGRPFPGRRSLLRGAGLLGAAGLLSAGGAASMRQLRTDPHTVISLWSQTVAFDGAGERVLVGARGTAPAGGPVPGTPLARGAGGVPASALLEGTRLVGGFGSSHPMARAADAYMKRVQPWLSAVPAELEDLARTALLDLWVLSESLPAPVAGWSQSWRYIWPRDAAFCAVALARVGHLDRAVRTLQHLQQLQSPDGWFEARYDPVTGQRPDLRPRQLDGTGLLLWAAGEVLAAAEASRSGPRSESSAESLTSLTDLVERSASLLMQVTEAGAVLPPATPDYWEVREKHVTLWTMATVLRGLRSASELTGESAVAAAGDRFETLLRGSFGAHGYQRYRTGGGADSALALFDTTGMGDVVPSGQLETLRSDLARPGGGIAPGAAWRDDGVSWTPATSLLGVGLARAGRHEQAHDVLTWLSEHRTKAGSLPEKVLFDGRPAEVAPLAWTAANVLLAIDALSAD